MTKTKDKNGTLKVVELFAGVGGFRLGLEKKVLKNRGVNYDTVWFNQWEPATKVQDAWKIYVERFKINKSWAQEKKTNCKIEKINASDLPEHDLLVGGFPCQDYSVAQTLSRSSGLGGKKGVLWWEIHRLLKELKKRRTKYLMLENVDRLLKSPASQRGRDFAIMLSSLNELGYIVEWRVINAAEYGMPQRRRRVFILGYHRSTKLYKRIIKLNDFNGWIANQGVVAKAFPVEKKILEKEPFLIDKDLVCLTKTFHKDNKGKSPFLNAGIFVDGKAYTFNVKAEYNGKEITLDKIIYKELGKISEEFFVNPKDYSEWRRLKGSKADPRKSSSGHTYKYTEGSMSFPDPLDRPSRTIITGEGGPSPSRFKHVIAVEHEKYEYRRLIPEELEKLNMFRPGFTKLKGISSNKRAFFMGNALVVGVVERLGEHLFREISKVKK